ncbi:hypothetical protein ACFPES_12735 [Paenibacillus sp. GCM10023248]|uniref:hypothetical protein n=1 Tax=Bacillales TaxID=1385 RepID=UPI0023786EF0|nr:MULTISPECIES: hypothetical protein [Bacillales]MDD9267895.1 hypothetical protein [Paenibacillus sp. MAHUQ-63]MDR6882327.1 putative RNA-binding Zn-ribbon protein involved in translation (DUF1610 family) [Bacillus sp. 3255]
MSNKYKVRAYCSSRQCDYVHQEDVVRAINSETSYALALSYNEAQMKPSCPKCGEAMAFYAHSIIDEPWLP